jgi:hypothetical protein
MAALALVAAALAQYVGVPTGWLRQGEVHVAPLGSDLFLGHSPRFPLRSIRRAVALAEPGETIVLWPGLYRETVHWRRSGRPGRPIRLRAAIPGQAVVSGAAPTEITGHWRWTRVGTRIHSTQPPWPLQALRLNGQAAPQAHSLAEFHQLCRRHGAWPLFHQQRQPLLLWLCLPDGGSPAAHTITVHRPLPQRSNAGGHQNASLWIDGSHLEISHLHFDFAVGAAIQLLAARDVRIVHNLFSGADVGVNGNPSRHPPTRIRIEHNAFHHTPQASWRGWLSWRELYRYSNSSLVSLGGRDLTIRANLITDAGDAIRLAPSAGRNVVSNNLIAGSTDDALELDGTRAEVSITGNLVAGSFANLSFSPMPRGQVGVHGNLFLNGPANGHNTWLKLLGGSSCGLRLSRNLFVGEWIGWYDGGILPGCVISRHNRLFSRALVGPTPAAFVPSSTDQHSTLAAAQWPEPAAGPNALLGPPPPQRAHLHSLGPCWLDARHHAAFQHLRPLLASAWMQPPYQPSICR